MGDKYRFKLVGESWPVDKEDPKKFLYVVMKHGDEPLSKSAGAIAKKLGVPSLDGLTLCKAKLLKGGKYICGDPLDMDAPVPIKEDSKLFSCYVKEGDGPAKAAPPPKPAADGGADSKGNSPKEGGPPPPPEAPKPDGAKDGEDEPKKSPKKVVKKKVKPKPEGADDADKKAAPTPPETPASPASGDKDKKDDGKDAVDEAKGPGAKPALIPDYQPTNAGLSEQDDIRRQLVEFYMRHNPVQVSKIPQILEAFKGEEATLLKKVKEKYEKAEYDGMAYYKEHALKLPSIEEMGLGEATPEARALQKLALEAKVAEAQKEKEKQLREEDERVLADVRGRLASVNNELQELRRREAQEREERDARERRDREERELLSRREFERSAQERRALETLIRDREHAQQLREDDIERRERELRRQRDELIKEKELLRHKELDTIERTDDERRYLQDRAEKMISMIVPPHPHAAMPGIASPPAHGAAPEGGVMPKAAGVLASLHLENQQLKDELQRLQDDLDAPRHTTHLQDVAAPAKHIAVSGGGGLPVHPPATPVRGGGEDMGPAASPPLTQPPGEDTGAGVPVIDDVSAEFRPVEAVLERAGLEKYVEVFKAHDFNLQAFAAVTDADLKELGITGVGARKRLVAEAQRQRLLASAGGIAAGGAAPAPAPATNGAAPDAAPYAPPAPAPYWNGMPAAPPAPGPPMPAFTPPPPLPGMGAGGAPPAARPPVPLGTQVYNYIPEPTQQATRNHLRAVEDKLDHLVDRIAARPPPSTSPPAPTRRADPHAGYPQPPPPVPPPPPTAGAAHGALLAAPDAALAWHRDLLTRFYQTFDPVKLPQVPRILGEYHDRLGDLYRTLTSVYDVEASPYADRVWRVCATVAPGREVAANVLCRLCKGREAELLEHLLSEGSSIEASLLDQVARWSQQEDPASGRTYYYSEMAREAQWSKPAVLLHRDALVEQGIANVAKVPPPNRVFPFSSVSQNVALPPNPSPYESINYQPTVDNAQRARASHHRAWLLAYLMKHDPARVPEVSAILARYAGNEDLMVEQVRAQYEGYASA